MIVASDYDLGSDGNALTYAIDNVLVTGPIFSPNGGTVSLPATTIVANASSALDLGSPAWSATLGALTLAATNGATLTIQNAAGLTLNGSGGLAISATGGSGTGVLTGSVPISIASGGINVDLGATLSIGNPIQDASGTATVLTKVGGGVLALTASNTYTGPTTINQGALLVNGSLASAVTVNSGGTLGGTGHLSSGTVSAGGCIAPGNLPQGLSFSGGLLLASGAEMDYALDTPSTSDEISCGSLIVSSPLGFSNFDFTWTANFAPGTYNLIESGSLPSGVLGTSTSGTIDGYPATLAVHNNDLVLTVVPEPSTLALLAAGGLGLLGLAWLRKVANKWFNCDSSIVSDFNG